MNAKCLFRLIKIDNEMYMVVTGNRDRLIIDNTFKIKKIENLLFLKGIKYIFPHKIIELPDDVGLIIQKIITEE